MSFETLQKNAVLIYYFETGFQTQEIPSFRLSYTSSS